MYIIKCFCTLLPGVLTTYFDELTWPWLTIKLLNKVSQSYIILEAFIALQKNKT